MIENIRTNGRANDNGKAKYPKGQICHQWEVNIFQSGLDNNFIQIIHINKLMTFDKPCVSSIQQSNQMSQITINNVFEKIRSICKECAFLNLPDKFSGADNNEIIQIYVKTLESIRLELIRFHQLQEQYGKLQRILQKGQTQLRRRVGIENELKLYIEALKQQNQQLQREKLQFLDNTKTYIKQLKKVNQNLFTELTTQINKNKMANLETMQKSNKKLLKEKIVDINKSLNRNKAKRQKSIKQIVKTQFIDRQKFNTETKKQRKIHHYKLHSSIMSQQEGNNHNLEQNLRTFQQYNAANTERNTKNNHQELTKGNSHLVSNQALGNFFEESKMAFKKIDRQKIAKSPFRLQKKEYLNKKGAQNPSRHQSRQRKHNRSVYSVMSAEQIQNQKYIF